MAGSYKHAVDDAGRLRDWEEMADMATETQGDAYETIEEMYGMIWLLADGDAAQVEAARQSYRRGIEMSPSAQ